MIDTDDTIVALASPGGGERGVVRVSGPALRDSLSLVFEPTDHTALPVAGPPRLLQGTLNLDVLGSVDAQVYIWPTTRSYTRQPTAEIHTVGALPILEQTMKVLCQVARPAQPGEFTLRAFLAGRLDLTQAEAVLGIIDARDESDFELALKQLAGGLVHPLQAAREQLLNAVAHLEAGLDFVEEDIEFISVEELTRVLGSCQAQLQGIQEQLDSRQDAQDSCQIVFFGMPNVGKSSLVNALSQRPVALVSETAGTTRDYVIGRRIIAGQDCLLIDTAGLDPTLSSGIDAAAQSATREQQVNADLRVLCLDLSRTRNDWELAQLAQSDDGSLLVVGTKSDLGTDQLPIEVSSQRGTGFDVLVDAIANWLETNRPVRSPLLETTARCQSNLNEARAALDRGQELLGAGGGEELIAMELRLALEEIGRIVGVVYTDDILDQVFSRFCIGK